MMFFLSIKTFSNLDGNIKHYKAQCKGSVYWMDYDIDVPAWFKRLPLYKRRKR